MTLNPIVGKELLQLARQKRTYWVRAVLPAAAAFLFLMQGWGELSRTRGDWRAVAAATSFLFGQLAWLQLAAFSVLAYAVVRESLEKEWTGRTMAVLCTTGLSPGKILLGKFGAMLSNVLIAALAVFPVTVLALGTGRLPLELGLGSAAVIFGSVLLCGSLGLVEGTGHPATAKMRTAVLRVILVALVVGWMLLRSSSLPRPLLVEAVLPPVALSHVLAGAVPGGMGVLRFSLLSLLSSAAVSALLFGRAFVAFGRAVSLGGALAKTSPPFVLRVKKRLAGRRPPMAPDDDPFAWQERGPQTRLLSSMLWLVYGATLAAGGVAAQSQGTGMPSKQSCSSGCSSVRGCWSSSPAPSSTPPGSLPEKRRGGRRPCFY